MKKFLFSIFALFFSFFLFAFEVSDLLLEAQTAYESGDVSTAIQKIDSAKSIMAKDQLSSSVDDYIEVSNWDIVKLKKSEYIGKKVKVKTRFYGINSDGKTVHLAIGLSCTFDNSLVDKFLELTKYQEYVFYGTVIENNSLLGPMIHIEAIE